MDISELEVVFKKLDYSQYDNNTSGRLYAASLEEERPYKFFVATKGIGATALSMMVSLEFYERKDAVDVIDGSDIVRGRIAVNLCLKNIHLRTAFKYKSFLDDSGFWAPEDGSDLVIESPHINIDLVRGYFTDIETPDLDIQQLYIELDTFMETTIPDRLPT